MAIAAAAGTISVSELSLSFCSFPSVYLKNNTVREGDDMRTRVGIFLFYFFLLLLPFIIIRWCVVWGDSRKLLKPNGGGYCYLLWAKAQRWPKSEMRAIFAESW